MSRITAFIEEVATKALLIAGIIAMMAGALFCILAVPALIAVAFIMLGGQGG